MTKKSGKRILSVTIKKMYDESPDTLHLGEYSDIPTSDFSIDRATDEFCGDLDTGRDMLERIQSRLMEMREDVELDSPEDAPLRDAVGTSEDLIEKYIDVPWNAREYRYFNPSFNYVDKAGETPETVRKYTREDYERMESLNRGDWCYIGICAEAEIIVNAEFSSATLGPRGGVIQRVGSGGLWGIESDSEESYFAEIEADELSNLKSELLAIGFSKRAISTAFKNVERKEALTGSCPIA